MPQSPASPVKTAPKTPAKSATQPPDERFWKRYSRHHEFPISSVASIVIHSIMVLVLVLIGIAVIASHNQPLPMDTIALSDGGGGGNPEGDGNGPGNGVPPPPSKEVAANDNDSKVVAAPRQDPNPDALPEPKVNPVELPPNADQRQIEPDNNAFNEISGRSSDLQHKLLEGLRAGKGQGGSGSGGGKGTGVGTGEGPGTGPGKGNIGVRQKRLLRWTLVFSTTTGEDYRRQLSALGAILAVPQPDKSYIVIRDLSHVPVHGKVEDPNKLNRIFWIDDKRESVAALSHALGIRPQPEFMVAFFPEELEQELLHKELAYRNRSEDEIRETRFEVRYEGGRYFPVVVDQTTN